MTAATLDDLPYIPAWDNGVPGDGSDQTVALQAIADSLTSGGRIGLKGDVRITALNLNARRNIELWGYGSEGAGAAQMSQLRTYSGAGVARTIDARGTAGIKVKGLQIGAIDPAYNSTFMDLGGGSALASIEDVTSQINGAAGVLFRMDGTMQSSIRRTLMAGPGMHVRLGTGVGQYANSILFERVDHVGQNGGYAYVGSGDGLTWQSCNFEGGADSKGRAWASSTNLDFHGVTFAGCTFLDAPTPGFEWIEAGNGEGFCFSGNRMGGADPHLGSSYGIALGGGPGGVKGIVVTGNSFASLTAALNFGGTVAAQTNARGGLIAANRCIGGTSPQHTMLAIGFSTTQRIILLPNEIDSIAAGELGSRVALPGLQTFSSNAAAISGGLAVGEVYRSSSSGALLVVI